MAIYDILRSVMKTLRKTAHDWIGEKNLLIFIICCTLLYLCSLMWYETHLRDTLILLSFRYEFYLLLVFSFLLFLLIPALYFYTGRVSGFWYILQIITLSLIGYPLGASLVVESLLAVTFIVSVGLFSSTKIQAYTFLTVFFVLQVVLQHTTRIEGTSVIGPEFCSLLIYMALLLMTGLTVLFIRRMNEHLTADRARVAQLEQASRLLINANRSFQEYAYDVEEKSKKEERMRITREIHDLVGYSTINVSMMLEEAIDHYVHDDVVQLFPLILKARDQTKATHQDIRKVLEHFRADQGEVLTTANDMMRMTKKFSEVTGVRVDFTATQAIPPVSTEIKAQLQRIIQEGLTNAIQHGKANRIFILLSRENNNIRLVIEDNGTGAEQLTEGIGLTGMRERLSLIGGEMKIINAYGEFRLVISIPMPERSSSERIPERNEREDTNGGEP